MASSKKTKKDIEAMIEGFERRNESCERRHLESCGKQVNSIRSTNPDYSFGIPFRPVLPTHANSRFELGEESGPGPQYIVKLPSSPTKVLKGWGAEERWPENVRKIPGRAIIHSTHASPFSALYPYEDYKRTIRKDREECPRGKLAPLHHEATGVVPKWEIKLPNKPCWSFGSSGVGSRFQKGTKFSRMAPIKTTSAKPDWKEQRDRIPISFESGFPAAVVS
mmetsp:Transcript_55916/g.88666  ORF Transcript_55916/g.88666 Transcript_55916/m.88666 type:complete len:222 (-) Transcript_55916:33-698(-)